MDQQPDDKVGITLWMPKTEYEALQKMKEGLTDEQRNRMNYFFWNNFSSSGYEDWRSGQETNKIQDIP